MITVSLCMIVKNEEDTIGRCLDSVKEVVDEFVIVDTGSSDNTKNVIKKYTNNIYDFKWIDDFSAARNFAFSKATKEYIFWLDADDILLPEDIKKFKFLKKNLDTSIDSVTMKYNISFDEYGNITTSYRRNRLVKREKNLNGLDLSMSI
ncbi:SPBc2 prophage-derived glycosyltransferase SunS [Clostridium ljungdahlii]|uniref:SPBc2 prophage-derived glycosyltransferase SunS n=1 Tax=Clostridium ljungdahlii TaxID=1538 RepID=A0A168LKQ8_9CLOT|nr:SPBc2 prophage-derived glycosyltransferase SunS [Clostridium ljungdahlii]